jgi:hypothetical protein
MSMFRDAEEDILGGSHILSNLPSENKVTAASCQTKGLDQCSTWGDTPKTNGGPESSESEGISSRHGHYGCHGYGSHSDQNSRHTIHITINNAFLLGTISLHYRDNSGSRSSNGGHIINLYNAEAASSRVLANPKKKSFDSTPADCTGSDEFSAEDMEIPDTVWSRYWSKDPSDSNWI